MTAPTASSLPPGPSGKTLIVLIVLTMMLMVFSVIAWRMGNQTLAGTAGLGAIGLIGDVCRRLLGDSGPPPPPAVTPGEVRTTPPTGIFPVSAIAGDLAPGKPLQDPIVDEPESPAGDRAA